MERDWPNMRFQPIANSRTNLCGQTEGSNLLQSIIFVYKIGISTFLPFVDQHQHFGNREVPTCQLFHHDSASPEELLFFLCFFFFFFLSSSSSCDDALSDLLFFLFSSLKFPLRHRLSSFSIFSLWVRQCFSSFFWSSSSFHSPFLGGNLLASGRCKVWEGSTNFCKQCCEQWVSERQMARAGTRRSKHVCSKGP